MLIETKTRAMFREILKNIYQLSIVTKPSWAVVSNHFLEWDRS